jgi:hypothetical protein
MVHLNGHTCLRCGQGFYDGYQKVEGQYALTQPCNRCGHIAPAEMPGRIFDLWVKGRNIEADVIIEVPTVPCICCGKKLEADDPRDNQPRKGLAFQSHGHWPSTLFDPMDGTYLEVNICDGCLLEKAKDGLVLVGKPPERPRRKPLKKWTGK